MEVHKRAHAMDGTAWEMVKIVRDSGNRRRRQDAAEALLAMAVILDRDSVDEVIWEMTKIIRDSENDERRSVTQRVLIVYKGTQHMT